MNTTVFVRKKNEWPVLSIYLLVLSVALSIGLYFIGEHQLGLVFLAFVLFISIVLSPQVGMIIFGVTFPYAGMVQVIPGIISLTKAIAICLLISWILRTKKEQIRYQLSSRTIQSLMYLLAWSFITIPFYEKLQSTLLVLLTQSLLFGLVIILPSFLAKPKQIRRFVWSLLVGAGSVFFIGEILGFQHKSISRSGERLSFGVNENELASILVLILLLSPLIFYNRSIIKKYLLVILITLDASILMSIILTYSRNGWFALVGSILLSPFFANEKKILRSFGYQLLIAAMVISTIFVLMHSSENNVQDKAMDRIKHSQNIQSGPRIDWIWPQKLNDFINSPIWGKGSGHDNAVHLSSHNDFIYHLSNLGIIGLLLFLLFQYHRYKEAICISSVIWKLIAVSIVLFNIIGGFAHTTFLHRHYALSIGIVTSMFLLEKKQKKLNG